MGKEVVLSLESRERSLPKSALSALRKNGWIPSVLYGGSEDHKVFSVSQKEFLKELFSSEVYKRIYSIDGCRAKVQSMEFDPVSDRLIHIDFMRL